jgi:predicted ATPase
MSEYTSNRPLNNPSFFTGQLNLSLKSLSYKTETNWVVITGAPSSGKTTIVNLFRKEGFLCVDETARIFIEQQLLDGRSLAEIRSNEESFQTELLRSKIEIESNIDPHRLAIFDRAIPDSLTYYRVAGLNPSQILDSCFNFKYKKIFHFDRLPLVRDNVRTEDEATANFIDTWLKKDYAALGYEVICVPVMSVEERVKFIKAQFLEDK